MATPFVEHGAVWPEIRLPLPAPGAPINRTPASQSADSSNLEQQLTTACGRPVTLCADPLDPLMAALAGPGDVVVVAEPTAPDVLQAVLKAGARYLDAGRTHDFRIHPDGWRYALGNPNAQLAVVTTPDEPTGAPTWPGAAREAETRGITVLHDQRFSLTPLALAPADGPVLRCLDYWAGTDGLFAVIGCPEAVELPAPQQQNLAQLATVLSAPAAADARSAQWTRVRRI